MIDDPVYPLKEYLLIARISRSRFYKDLAEGIAVEHFRRGDKIYVRHSAHLRHVEQLELREKRALAARLAHANVSADAREHA